ncbi:hypothetical protein PoB_007226700, partial [Plakobranchus ocellatus]
TDTYEERWLPVGQLDLRLESQSGSSHYFITPLCPPSTKWVARSLKTQRKKSPEQSDFKLSGPLTGQGAIGGARTRGRRVPADLTARSPAIVSPTPT